MFARTEKINRADLCVLLIEEFKLKKILENRRPELFKKLFTTDATFKTRFEKIISEIGHNRAKNSMLEIIEIGIPFLDLYPDGSFYPDRPVTRGIISVVAQSILVMVTDDPNLSTKYIGITSPFNDVHSNYYAFNAINLCIDKGIMEFPEDGNFKPESTVSGIEAVLFLRALQKNLGV